MGFIFSLAQKSGGSQYAHTVFGNIDVTEKFVTLEVLFFTYLCRASLALSMTVLMCFIGVLFVSKYTLMQNNPISCHPLDES